MSVKREADDVNGSDLKKRKVLDKLSEDGPLTQKDVVYFQKEAIFRQLQKHKKQVEVVRGEYNILQAEYNGCKDRFVLLSQWVDQFLEYVAGLVPGDGSSELEFFLSAPSSIVDMDILNTLNVKKDQFSKVAAKFDGNASQDVKNAVAAINKEFHNVAAKYDSLKADNEVLTNKYKKLSEELKELSDEHERLQSKTLGRVMKSKEEEHKTEDHNETKSDIAAKNESSSNNTGVEDAKVEELQALISQQKAMIDAQETTIKENIERFGKLSSTIQTQSNSDELINNSEKYQVLLKQKDDLQAKQVELVQRLEILENEVRESKDQAAYHKQSLDEFNNEKVKLEAQLNETKEKEERLRNQRDLYLTEIDVLKQKSNWKILNDLQDLVKAQEKQISTYNLEAKLAEAIPSEVSDVEQLHKKNALLLKEIGELEAAFQQLQSVRVPKILNAVEEEKRRKDLDVAKIKVDSKYRMLMEGEKYQQVTREKLETSFKVLKTSFEKLEASQVEYKNQIDTLNSELAELRKLSSKKELELKEYHKKCVKLEDGMKTETTQKKKAQHDFDTLKAEYQSLLISESSKASEASQLKSKLASQDKLIMRFKQTGSTEDSSELDSFRSLIYCSLCSKNWKNTAIKTCGHVFCESCAKERLAARMRKCPSCNKQFSSNDLLTIHL
jgi:E3 ubiquitin-protein ligase BRE1